MKNDINQQITDRFVGMIEKAIASGDKWSLPWRKLGRDGRPVNATSGHVYRGINVALLWGSADEAGYGQNRWATFKQWQDVGAHVRKGEKGTPVIFYKKLEIEGDNAGGEETDKRVIPMVRLSYVFNVAQVDDIPERISTPPVLSDRTRRHAIADSLVAASGAVIRHGGDQACYIPVLDEIRMPERDQFKGEAEEATEAYYATLLHELTHWTGHASRLDRPKNNPRGSEAYAFEELIAELGAAFLCAETGVSNVPRDDHAHYLASWLKGLKQDSRAIFRAATAAEKAVDFVKAAQEAQAKAA